MLLRMMAAAAAAAAAVAVLLLPAAAAKAKPVAYVGATVVSAHLAEPLADAVVIVDGGRITAVGPRASVTIPVDADTVDVAGKWIMPGMIDAHVHYFQSGGLYTRPDMIDLRDVVPYRPDEVASIERELPDTFRRYLASGITTTVDMGGPFHNFAVRDRARVTALAPRVVTAGPLLSTHAFPALDGEDRPIVRIDSTAQALALVRAEAKAGADLIKILFVVRDQGDLQRGAAMVRAVATEAHRRKLQLAVHATELETARAAVDAGADILVHSVTDRPVDQAMIDLLRQRGTLVVSTGIVMRRNEDLRARRFQFHPAEYRMANPARMASLFELNAHPALFLSRPNPPQIDGQDRGTISQLALANLKRMVDAGVRVAIGTDAGNLATLPGPSLQAEFVLLRDAGFSAAEILRGVTLHAAAVAGMQDRLGTVEAGKLADLLILDADPLRDIHNTERLHLVVRDGVAHTPSEVLPVDPASVVQAHVNAFNARDLPAFLASYAEDAEVADGTGARLFAGHAALREKYGPVFAKPGILHARILNRMVVGNNVVDLEEVTGTRAEPFTAIAAYEVRQGRIVRVRFLRGE